VKIIRYLLYAFALAFSSTAGAASNYSSLIVFGDSLSDPGNAAALTALGPYAAFFPPSPFPYDFRFTNGPTAPEYLAGIYAAPVVRGWPDPVGATNFAVGGALTGSGNYNVLIDSPSGLAAGFPAVSNTGISQQIARYNPSGLNPANTLFLLWGGPNDVFYGFAQSQAGASVDFNALASQAVTNMSNNVLSLASLGARNILVPNMPDLGLTPFALALGATFAASATGVTNAFNAGLASALSADRAALSAAGVRIFEFATAQFIRNTVAHPPAGLTNVSASCLSGGLAALAANCAGYLYFDDVHPTTFANQLLAQQFSLVAAVPEPGVYALLACGLLLIGAGRIGRRAVI